MTGPGEGQSASKASPAKVVGVAIVLLVVIAVLYWGGRTLLLGTGERVSKPETEVGFKECTPETTYTNLGTALREIGNVCALVLENQSLTSLPEDIGYLMKMQRLDVSGNQLTALPDTVGFLTQLKTLDVSNNQLTVLPDGVGFMTKMQDLDVSNNKLSAIPEEIGWMMELRSFNVSNNQLTTLPEQISWLQQSKTFNVSGNPLAPGQADRIRQLLPHVPTTF